MGSFPSDFGTDQSVAKLIDISHKKCEINQ